ncbi:acetyltransferase [Rhizobium laguerreae]|uniref:acetyltransferase n=1 Tax=Rhizobium laguerreae TaxID=1076926 RepID=UPI001C91C4CF|nr:acetyltransferase [Rhizobium laguerreae]
MINAAEILGIRGVLVHAISDDARAFYESGGFLPSSSDHMMLLVGLHDLNNARRGGRFQLTFSLATADAA